MAFQWTPLQPIVAASIFNCTPCSEGCAAGDLIDTNDTKQVQITVYPCDNAISPGFSLRINPLSMGEWTYIPSKGNVCSSAAGTGTFWIEYPNATGATMFEVKIDVVSTTSGTLVMNLLGGDEVEISAPGSYKFYLKAALSENTRIEFNSDNWIGCFTINGLEILPVPTNYKIGIFDSNDVCKYLWGSPVIDDNYLTFTMDLGDADLSEGCYYFGILDPCDDTCGQNGFPQINFDNTDDWENLNSPGYWSISDGKAVLQSFSTLPQIYSNLAASLCPGLTYTITYDIVSIDEGVTFRMGVSNIGVERTAVGSYSDNFLVQPGLQNVRLVGSCPDGSGKSVEVANIRVFVSAESVIASKKSICYSVGDYAIIDSCQILKLEGCCAGNAFGFNFNNFRPTMRLSGDIHGFQPVVEGEIWRKKSGKKVIPYYDVVFEFIMGVNPAPAYVHGFLSIWLGFNVAVVNGVKVVPSQTEYPELDFSNSDIAPVQLVLEEKMHKTRRILCTEDIDCEAIFNAMEGKVFQDGSYFFFQNGKIYLLQ